MNLWSHRFSQNTNKKLSGFLPSLHRAEILTIFRSYFGRNDDFINSFWSLLTFTHIFERLCIFLDLLEKNLEIFFLKFSNNSDLFLHSIFVPFKENEQVLGKVINYSKLRPESQKDRFGNFLYTCYKSRFTYLNSNREQSFSIKNAANIQNFSLTK